MANAKAAELEMKLREREQKYEKQNDELTTLLREKSEVGPILSNSPSSLSIHVTPYPEATTGL